VDDGSSREVLKARHFPGRIRVAGRIPRAAILAAEDVEDAGKQPPRLSQVDQRHDLFALEVLLVLLPLPLLEGAGEERVQRRRTDARRAVEFPVTEFDAGERNQVEEGDHGVTAFREAHSAKEWSARTTLFAP